MEWIIDLDNKTATHKKIKNCVVKFKQDEKDKSAWNGELSYDADFFNTVKSASEIARLMREAGDAFILAVQAIN